MTISDARNAIGRIERLFDGSEESVAMMNHLTSVLIEQPHVFWDEYFLALNPPRQESFKVLERFETDATFADLWSKAIREAA